MNRDLLAPEVTDTISASLRRIETVAGLLQASGAQTSAEPLDANLAANSGALILEETTRLREILKTRRPKTITKHIRQPH